MKQLLIILGIVVFLIFGAVTQCSKSEANEIGSSIDWGDGYYWDSSTESVQETLW